MRKLLIFAVLILASLPAFAAAQIDTGYPDRRAIIANVCPHLKITKFSFANIYERSADRYVQDFSWENVGSKPIVAFELVTLKYDPFNDAQIGGRSVLPGHNSATYKHLAPGESDADGSSSLASESTFTAVLYVRSVRFADHTVWNAAPADVLASMKQQVPDILVPGGLVPKKEEKAAAN